jgi:hypothetical protein
MVLIAMGIRGVTPGFILPRDRCPHRNLECDLPRNVPLKAQFIPWAYGRVPESKRPDVRAAHYRRR